MAITDLQTNRAADEESIDSQTELQQLLAEVRHVLAQRLEIVATVSKQLAELCDHVESHLAQSGPTTDFSEAALDELPPSPLTDGLRHQQQRLLLQTLRDVARQMRAAGGAGDWWQEVESKLAVAAR